MTQPEPQDPHEGINPDANPESEAVANNQSSYVARGGSTSGIINEDTQPGDEQLMPHQIGGTAAGDPLAGVTATDEELEDAVSGDTGPEHPGQR